MSKLNHLYNAEKYSMLSNTSEIYCKTYVKFLAFKIKVNVLMPNVFVTFKNCKCYKVYEVQNRPQREDSAERIVNF